MTRLMTVDEQIYAILNAKPTKFSEPSKQGPVVFHDGGVVDLREEQPVELLDTHQGANMRIPSLCNFVRELQAAQREGDTPALRTALAQRNADRADKAKWPKDYEFTKFEGAYDSLYELVISGWYKVAPDA